MESNSSIYLYLFDSFRFDFTDARHSAARQTCHKGKYKQQQHQQQQVQFCKENSRHFSISTDFSNNLLLLSFFLFFYLRFPHSRLKRNRLQTSKLKVSKVNIEINAYK